MKLNDPFQRLTPIDSLPIDWQNWRNNICSLMGLDPSKYLLDQALPKPLLLIPEKEELVEVEAKKLMGTVYNYLSGTQNPQPSSIIKRMATLHPEASIPLLYIMRYIAFQDAKSHYFWPEFRKQLFLNKISYEDVALGMAQITSMLWLNLYQYTNGRLYYPKEGPRHIKWPLAHAGLIPPHKKSLKEFGFDLAREGKDELEETLDLEVDEFLMRLEDWLHGDNERSHSNLATVLAQKGPNREIIAELGLHWLKAKQRILLEEVKHREDDPIRKKANLVRRKLVYDAEKNQLLLSISPGRTKGNPLLLWDESKYQFQTQFSSKTKEYISLDLRLQLYKPEWPAKANIQIGSIQLPEITIPIIEKGKGIVFDLDSGYQTKRWELGQQYYILIPSNLLHEKPLNKLFSEWLMLPQPNGRWQDYYMLLVHTQDPFGDKNIVNNPVKIIEELEENAEQMGLPSFGHQYQARVLLFGGKLTNLCARATNSQFTTLRPPFAEILGIWKDPLVVDLVKLNERTGQYEKFGRLPVSEEFSGHTPVFEVFEGKVEIGEYKLFAGEDEKNFAIEAEEEGEDKNAIPAMELDCWFEDEQKIQITKAGRGMEGKLSINIRAWPLANLEILIHGGGWERAFEIQIDDKGAWRLPLIDLGIEFEKLPKGNISFTVSWQGFTERSIFLYEENFLIPSEILVETQIADDAGVIVSGKLKGYNKAKLLFGSLLPALPWQSDYQPFVFKLKADGSFRTETDKPTLHPRWLLISGNPNFETEENNILGIAELQQTAQNIMTTKFSITQEYPPQWSTIAGKLKEIPHPASLEPFLAIDPIMIFMRENLRNLDFSRKWRILDSFSMNPSLENNLKERMTVSIFLAPIIKTTMAQEGYSYKIISTKGNESIADEITISTESQLSNAVGKLYFRDSNGSYRFTPNEGMRVCLKCGQIIPVNDFQSHNSAFSDLPNCNMMGMLLRNIPAGVPINVDIAMYLNPLDELNDIQQLLIRLAKGEKFFTPGDKSWLIELGKVVPLKLDRRDWLVQLIQKIDLLKKGLSKETLEFKDFVAISPQFELFGEGLRLIFRRISEKHKLTTKP